MSRRLVAASGLLLALGSASLASAQPTPVTSSCLACHGNPAYFDKDALASVVEASRDDAHTAAGLSCHDCHGGNPDPALAEDPQAAMAEGFAPNPFRGAPDRAAIPAFCGRCHSDPEFMKRFDPGLRVDQEREYWTSHHGKALQRGDVAAATCTDCHGAHGILEPGNPRSSVYPPRVAETCRACHDDAQRMAGRQLADGRPLPVDQYARWRQSVHARALLEKEDLSAPTCNDCHGNHGAVPPGLESIAFVCGQCHGREAELFRGSSKRTGFEEHNELMAGAEQGCADCHVDPEPQSKLTIAHAFSECASCHGNHSVVRPTVAMLSPLPETPCAFCHEPGPAAQSALEARGVQRHYEAMREALLAEAQASGVAAEARFDWLVDRAQALPVHTVTADTEGGAVSRLRPEFERLFGKFRIGKTYASYQDPATGEERRVPVVRCSDCHAAQPQLTSEAKGAETAAAMIARMRDLIGSTARAERLVLAARRGGVETRQALLDIDKAVDSQIELEVLVHGFEAGEGSAFALKHAEGLEHAQRAVAGGQAALGELGYRRKGLGVALGIALVFLVVLALKIRQVGSP